VKSILFGLVLGLLGLPHLILATSPTPGDSLITIAAVGDIMMGTTYPEKWHLPPQDGQELFPAVASELQAADITFGNLEGPLVNGGKPRKVCSDPSHCYLFRTPTRYVRHLVAAGFDLLGIANNHARDFGDHGLVSTMRILDSVRIAYSGKAGDWAQVSTKGKSVALIAYAPYDGLNHLRDIEAARTRVQEMAAKFDLVIISFHGGAEGSGHTRTPDKMEIYFGEERGHVRKFAHAVIDAGADLVLGHGPHVPRGLEVYKNRLIAYSLGNFCTYAQFNLKGACGLSYILKVNLNFKGEFCGGKIIPCMQIEPGIPKIDPNQAVIPLLTNLSQQDFQATAARIAPDGTITAPVPVPPANRVK
jgi:poly-gamma-glutamate capsule biosynthesis protein CapA/YwtB (metallophosphatase superfamily)